MMKRNKREQQISIKRKFHKNAERKSCFSQILFFFLSWSCLGFYVGKAFPNLLENILVAGWRINF